MKRRNLLIAIAVILVMFAFVACSESVAPEDRLGTITFGKNSSRAVGTVVQYSDDVEDMYWYYSAKKLDDGFTTGNTGGKLVAVSSEKGLSGKTLESTGFSYGLWEIQLKGFKSSDNTAAGVDITAEPKYYATLNNFRVSSTVNYATANIQLGDGATTAIEFGDITFSSSNILATSKFSLAVTDNNNTGTVTVPTGDGNVVAEKGKVTFKNLTYTPNEGADITGDHEMSFALTQTLSGDDNVEIKAAQYTLKFTVIGGTTTTISGSLLKNDQTGTIQINSVQDVPEITMSKAIPVKDVTSDSSVATVSTDTEITYGNMMITLPAGTKIATTETGLSEDNSSADGTIAFKAKSSSSNQNDITVESDEGITPYELILPVSTVEDDGDKKNTQLVTVTNFIGKNRNITNICHNKTSIAELTTAPSAEGFTDPTVESWYYDKDSGYLTLYLFHASEINIIERKPVAVVGGEEKYYLSDAISAISENGTLELLRDVTVDKKGEKAENIAVGKSFTLDLKNHSVTISSNGSSSLSADKIVTVLNSKPEQAVFINAVEVKDFTGVNRAYYPTLEAALEAVTEGGTVTLGAAVTLSSSDVEISNNITLDLSGKVLTPDGKGITVKSGTLTVKGSSTDQTAFVTGVASANTINGTYAPRVAKIGEVYYSSLSVAAAAVAKDGTIELLCDITLTDPITITESIKLDLNSHVITASGSNLIYVNAGTLAVSEKAEKQGEFVFGVKGANDTYTASVAQIGNNDYYATLEAAIDAAEDGDTVVLLQDYDATSRIEIKKDLTIDLNKKTLQLSDYFLVNEHATDNVCTVSIKDGYINALIELNSGGADVFQVKGGGTLVIENVEIVDNTPSKCSDATISIESWLEDTISPKVVIRDSKVINKNATDGLNCINLYHHGDATVPKPILQIENSQIIAEGTISNGIGMHSQSTDSEITISKNSVVQGTQCGILHREGNLTIKDSEIIVTSSGYALLEYDSKKANVELENVKLTTTSSDGVALAVDVGATVKGTLTNDSATTSAGSKYEIVKENGVLTIKEKTEVES